MAGFAINVDLILKNKNAVLGMDEHGKVNRRLEDTFLKQFTTRETAECLGGREVNNAHCYDSEKQLSNYFAIDPPWSYLIK